MCACSGTSIQKRRTIAPAERSPGATVARRSALTPLSGVIPKGSPLPRHANATALRRVLSWLAAVALVGLGLSLGAGSASADAPYSITGTISDTTTAGIGVLSLSLFDSSSALVDTVSTGGDGSYEFDGLADGTYLVETTGPTGYVAIHATAIVADANLVLNITDARYGTVTGGLTSGAAPVAGVSVRAVDSATDTEYDADSLTDASGNFSITLPASTGGYAFSFTSAAGTRLPIASYDLSGAVVGTSPCLLTTQSTTLAGLADGSPIDLTVVLDSAGGCGPVAAAPAAAPRHAGTLLAQTGSTVVATPSPTPTASMDASDTSRQTVTTFTAPAGLKPLLTPTASDGRMPEWGWLLVIVAVLALLGGVGFTVVRHR
jgi:hypothetical protein